MEGFYIVRSRNLQIKIKKHNLVDINLKQMNIIRWKQMEDNDTILFQQNR